MMQLLQSEAMLALMRMERPIEALTSYEQRVSADATIEIGGKLLGFRVDRTVTAMAGEN